MDTFYGLDVGDGEATASPEQGECIYMNQS